MSDLLITHVDVLTDEGVLKNHAIAINNGYITAILNDSEAEKVKVSAKEVLDGKGQLATPGLVNTLIVRWVYLETMQMILSLWNGLKRLFGQQKQN